MVDNEIKILSTRNLDASLIDKAAQKNIFINHISFIKTDSLITHETAEKIKILSSQKVTVIFTSKTAVEFVHLFLSFRPDWKIFCTGGITKLLIQDLFGEGSIAGTASNATLLANKIIEKDEVKNIIFFCGKQRLNILPETLKNHKIIVQEIIVYSTQQTPHIVEENYNGIIFFSPSAVHSFFSVNTVSTDVILFSLGKTTAATIKTYCTNKIIVSRWPDAEQIIDDVTNYFSNK